VAGNNDAVLIGDPGCGPGVAGIGFTTGSLSKCANFSLAGDDLSGDTILNSTGSAGGIAFTNQGPNGTILGELDSVGDLSITGKL
jgi:hypothetical protein